jgi:hypothetical protein
MDGFHRPNAYLDSTQVERDGCSVPLRAIKGEPLSFDLGLLQGGLRRLKAGSALRWPAYDRRLHDPVEGAIEVPLSGVCVVEGNYLLLDEPGWRDLAALADFKIFLDCPEPVLRADKIARLVRGGRSCSSALSHYASVDRLNLERICRHRMPADITLRVDEERGISLAEPE